jgi:hypothetical protein
MDFDFDLPDAAPVKGASPAFRSHPPDAAGIELLSLRADGRDGAAVEEPKPPPAMRIFPPSTARMGQTSRPSTPARRTPTPQPAGRAATPAEAPPRASNDSVATLVRQNSDASEPDTPVMRSIFPRFNPDLAPNRQSYHPNMEAVPPQLASRAESRGERAPSVASPRPQDHWGVQHQARPSNVSQTQLPPPAELSSTDDLVDLWALANGQGEQLAAETFVLGLQW